MHDTNGNKITARERENQKGETVNGVERENRIGESNVPRRFGRVDERCHQGERSDERARRGNESKINPSFESWILIDSVVGGTHRKRQRAKHQAQRAKSEGQRAKGKAQSAECQRKKLFALCPSLLALCRLALRCEISDARRC